MVKGICACIWAGLCFWTLHTGEATVISQSVAQGSLALILLLSIKD
ncbi:Acridine resistance [Escherichia phage EcS1]|uniref:Acridine resistance n=1 Tax=Escherichia phage EcS1 TaxID=2083276 RepID=A0A2Z5ZCW4_9CAUD|nr:Acridine resistance [Escherichia phage EcS1]BBC78336.1 Acridine resistance [Escherichia phage EcS1]